jgi:putative ABC transport system permease protein
VKYLPLVWAALRRNPAESALTLLAMTVAFTLFGSMIALNAAYDRVLATVRMDRLQIFCAFPCGGGIPIGYGEQLARIPGVTGVGYSGGLGGYHQERSNGVSVVMVDAGMRDAWSELSLSADDWQALQSTPTGLFFSRKAAALWNVSKGDTFAIVADPALRADGSATWIFTVLGVVEDAIESSAGQMPDLILGNYQYLNESLPPAEQNKHGSFRVAVAREDQARTICQQIQTDSANTSTPLFCVPMRDDAAQLANASVNLQSVSLGIAAAGLFMILFLCGNGIAESVRERLPELGVLKTLGFDDRRIALLVFAEAALMTLTGALLGTALAWIAGNLIGRLSAEVVRGTPAPAMSPGVLAGSIVAALLVALVSAALPIRRITRMNLAAVLAGK